jgi:hypothetical protein
MIRRALEDEDGIDGPQERAWQRAKQEDDRRARSYAERMARYAATMAAQRGAR